MQRLTQREADMINLVRRRWGLERIVQAGDDAIFHLLVLIDAPSHGGSAPIPDPGSLNPQSSVLSPPEPEHSPGRPSGRRGRRGAR